ncbi:MAG: glucokinase [Nevskia sp.]|nr:glucokinase [Nevskia sp.]
MIQAASQVDSAPAQQGGRRFIAADVGGTHARVAVVSARRGEPASLQVEQFQKYVCADYPSLTAILRQFLDSAGGGIEEGAVACAGYAVAGRVINTNLPWPVSIDEMRDTLGLRRLALVNDFEAVAHGVPCIDKAGTTLLSGPAESTAGGPVLVVGPGTGLGAAARIPSGHGTVVLATEAGQTSFAPGTDTEIEILRLLRRGATHVPVEQLLSGPGLVNLYGAVCALRGAAPVLRAPAAISDAAMQGNDAQAHEALEVFCGLLGSVVGDLVMLYRAQSGVYLAGGILPQIQNFLLHSTFKARFLDKGQMRPVLERVPVRLIEHGQIGVIGAASWYLGGAVDAAGVVEHAGGR